MPASVRVTRREEVARSVHPRDRGDPAGEVEAAGPRSAGLCLIERQTGPFLVSGKRHYRTPGRRRDTWPRTPARNRRLVGSGGIGRKMIALLAVDGQRGGHDPRGEFDLHSTRWRWASMVAQSTPETLARLERRDELGGWLPVGTVGRHQIEVQQPIEDAVDLVDGLVAPRADVR